MLVVSEPNKNAIRDRKDWVYDNELNSAIKVLRPSIFIVEQGNGSSFSYISTRNVTIYSCYSSGNEEMSNLENMLHEVQARIKMRREKAIITGDFHAKSPQWGMNFTDLRGQVVVDWMATCSLNVANKGKKPTFSSGSYGSILDLTITTEDVYIEQWEVSDTESLSDHN